MIRRLLMFAPALWAARLLAQTQVADNQQRSSQPAGDPPVWFRASTKLDKNRGLIPNATIEVDLANSSFGVKPGPGTIFVDGEVPAGVVDGTNATFTLAAAPAPASSVAIHRNGLRLKLGFDYLLSGATISFLAGAVPQPGDVLLADYRR